MPGRLTEAWRWWIDGLVDAVLLVGDRLRRDKPVRLVPVDGGFAVERATGRRCRRILRVVDGRLTPARLGRALTGRSVAVIIGADALLTRRLGPLPAESRAYLDGVVTHQLERMTPWLAADTLSVYAIETVAADDPRLMVRVDATSRMMHAGMLTALAAVSPREVRLLRPGTDGEADVVLPIVSADRGALRGRVSLFVQAGLAAVALITLAGGWWIYAASSDIEEQVAEVEERIAGYQRRLAPASGGERSDRDLIAALSRDTPMTVIALENLSAVLPDEASLDSLQIGRGRLRMIGVTRDIAELTTEIEATALFSDPVFSAPTVRLRQGDRFTLDLKVAGSTEAKR